VKVDVYNTTGKVVKQIEIRDDVFGVTPNEAVLHQALVRQLANRRTGTADTKTRGEVNKSGKKLFAQKHTGRARRGSAKTPLLKGGGVVFGPHPRSYNQDMPRKMHRIALRSALSVKVADGRFKVIEELEFAEPKTKQMLDILIALEIGDSVIVATEGVDYNLVKSARNIPAVKTIPANLLNVADLFSHKVLLITEEAIKQVEKLWGEQTVPEKVAE
jgi:large subunit ribosomal protein L4